MEVIKIPQKSKTAKLLILEDQLTRSYNLSLLFSHIYNGSLKNRNYSLTELGKLIGKSRAQVYQLINKLEYSEVIKSIKRKNKFIYVATDKIADETLVNKATKALKELQWTK